MSLARFYPLITKLRKLGVRPLSMAEDAVEVIEVHPEEQGDGPGIFMLERDREKVVSSQHQTTLEAEWHRVRGGRVMHRATKRYVFRDVLATPFGFYTMRAGHQLSGQRSLSELLSSDLHHLSRGYFGQPAIAATYFGHWLTDALPAALLARPEEALYLPRCPEWPHTEAYASRLGVSPLTEGCVHFEEMSYCVDIGMNADRRRRIRETYDRFQSQCGQSSASGLYIARGTSGARRVLSNEEDLMEVLAARGFAIVHTTDALETICDAGAGVDQVVTMEGSQAAHGVFLARPGALQLTINPADRFNNLYADYMPAVGQRMGTVVATRHGEDYCVDVASVLEVLDKA